MNLEAIDRKIKTLDELKDIVEKEKAAGKKVVFTNGCFDVLHVGHVRYLQDAAQYGDIVVTAINSDKSVSGLKGPERPLLNERDRMLMIAAVEVVDYVTVFGESRVDNLLLTLKPDFHAKGTDYTEESVPEKDIVASYGGQVIITGDPKDHSSSGVISFIKGDDKE